MPAPLLQDLLKPQYGDYMPMTVNGMSAAIKSALDGASPMSTSQQLADALAQAIVSYIKTNALVVTTCQAGAGTGTVT